jgi:RHS repeat-associated protein
MSFTRVAAQIPFAVLTISLLLCPPAFAQADASIEQGLKPYGSYMGGNLDTVSLTSGNLMLHIPLVSYPQRGGRLNLSFFLRYNNKGFFIRQWTFTNGLGQQQTASAWTWDGVGVDVARDQVSELRTTRGPFSAPVSGEKKNESFFLSLYNFITPDGSTHIIGGGADSGPDFGAGVLDGSALGFHGVQDSVDGTTQYTTQPTCPGGTSTTWYPLVSMDPNGNKITTTPTGWVDTLGRQIPGQPICTSSSPLNMGGSGAITGIPASSFSTSFTSNSGITSGLNVRMLPGVATAVLTGCPSNSVSARLWSLPAFNNSTVTMKFYYANFQIATNFAIPSVPEVQGTHTMLQNVILPNGTMWSFNYNSYGDLTFIGFPTGGSISYIWSTIQLTGGAKSRIITSRTVNANDGTGAHTWNYAWTPASTSNPITLILTDPAGNDSVHVSTATGYETEARYYQGSSSISSHLLKTVDTSYQTVNNPFQEYTGPSASPSFPTSVTTTWPNGKVSTVQTTYDTPTNYTFYDYQCLDCATQPRISTSTLINGQVISQSLFDYGNSTTPIRKTSTTYFTLDDPSTVITSDGNGNKCAETDFTYDNPSNLIVTSITQQHGAPYAGAVRANPSSITQWLATTPCSPSASWSQITSHTNYNDTGTLASSTDPLGNTTNYSYSPTFYGAYVTQTTLPPTGSTAHVISGNYDFNTGLLTSFTDQNNQSRTYTYDNMWRLAQANYPDGGQSTFTHQETSFPFTASVSKKIDSSRNLLQTSVFDGLGRVKQTQLNSDPDCPIGDKTDTTYDGLGRVFTVSNPYCSTSDPTYGLTTFAYDALGRTTQVTHPDSTTVLTTYTGRATQVQDEGNGAQRVTRISQSDGLGRLASLCEVAPGPFIGANGASASSLIGSGGAPASCGQDIAGTGFLTSYQYDTLGNLLQVNQSGIAPRTFAYDSLSRLKQATNPESGTICYGSYSSGVCQANGYDANGNLVTKTAPAPNQTGTATVATTFQYDALNRLTQKSYSDGTTPTAGYAYDTPNSNFACGTTTNGIGRLTGSAVPGWTFCLAYDPMGRLTDKDLHTPQNQWHYLDDAYDLLGNMTTETAGYAFHNVYYAYNTAARLTSVTSGLSDPQDPANVISGMHYNAFGSLTSATLGDGEAESYSYTKLGQLQSYGTSLNSASLYSFNIGTFAPNGDILAANDTANGNWTYSYDPFNRLVGSNKNSGAAVYSYVYDRFGNRWQQNGPQSFIATFTGNNPASPQNNNRMDGYSYDAAGNLLNDGAHSYTYDAENRIVAVDAGNTATYVYDADGRRVQKTSTVGNPSDPAGAWIFFYDQAGRWVQKFNSPGNTQVEGNIYAGGRHVATVGGGTNFSHSDWLGTERFRTTYAGAACESIASLPFGDGLTTTSPQYGACYHPSPLHFTGKERDSESGLDNFGARYDSSSTGRFMSPDPLYIEAHRLADPQRLNLYAYARNNPVNLTDPTGLDVALKCDTQANCNKAVQDFNGRKGAQFKVELGKDGKLHVVKGSVAKGIGGAEGKLLGAINDSSNHATINVSGNTGQSEFGTHDSKGVNSVDLENLSKLDAPSNAGGLNSGDALAHEAMDAYYSLSMGAAAADWAAADLFPGLLMPTNVQIDRTSGVLFGQTSDQVIAISTGSNGTGTERVTIQYITPIPFQTLNARQIQGAERAAGSRVTEVTFVPPKQ